MSLSVWLQNGWLVSHTASRDEIRRLLELADRDLKDSAVPGLSTDWQFSVAYNAALLCAAAALAAAGFRASREAHHFRVIQSLALTVCWLEVRATELDRFRKKRNIADYERAGTVSDVEAQRMLAIARDLRRSVEAWVRHKHPHLMRD